MSLKIRITDLPQATSLDGSELTLVVQAGVSKKASVNQVVNNAESVIQTYVVQAESAASNANVSASAASLSQSQAQSSAASAQGYATSAQNYSVAAAGSASGAAISASQSSDYAAQAAQSVIDAADASRLTIGVVTTGAPGSPADASITGDPGSQLLNLTIPAGDVGVSSVSGSAPIVSSGGTTPVISVTTGTTAGTVATGDHLHTGVYEPADATILKSSAIGVTVQAYDATTLKSADIGVSVQAYDATTLKSADIGVSVQAYDADLTSWAAIAPSAKQDTLISGTNIKTINGMSILGSGDLVVSGGGASGFEQTFLLMGA